MVCTLFRFKSAATTVAPSLAITRQIALPIPPPAPTTYNVYQFGNYLCIFHIIFFNIVRRLKKELLLTFSSGHHRVLLQAKHFVLISTTIASYFKYLQSHLPVTKASFPGNMSKVYKRTNLKQYFLLYC